MWNTALVASATALLGLAGTLDAQPLQAPRLIGVSPGDGVGGVRGDARIVLSFSAPMDRAATQAAFQSADLGAVEFGWNAAGTVLTVTPRAGLAYGVGRRLTYRYRIGGGARDQAGRALPPADLNFTTLRRQTALLSSTPDLEGTVSAGQGSEPTPRLTPGEGPGARRSTRALLSFDLAGLPPEVQAQDIEWASLHVFQRRTVGRPYSRLCNPVPQFRSCLLAQHVAYGARLDPSAYFAARLGGMGDQTRQPAISDDTAVDWKAIEATEAVRDDRLNRSGRDDRSQFRLEFYFDRSQGSGAAGNAAILADSQGGERRPRLVVTYLAP